MALINCPECNGRVSDTSDRCVHCGYFLKKGSHIIITGINPILKLCGSISISVGNVEWGTLNIKTDENIKSAHIYSESASILSIRLNGRKTIRYRVDGNRDIQLRLLMDRVIEI